MVLKSNPTSPNKKQLPSRKQFVEHEILLLCGKAENKTATPPMLKEEREGRNAKDDIRYRALDGISTMLELLWNFDCHDAMRRSVASLDRCLSLHDLLI